jgi:hypothetical protein
MYTVCAQDTLPLKIWSFGWSQPKFFIGHKKLKKFNFPIDRWLNFYSLLVIIVLKLENKIQ